MHIALHTMNPAGLVLFVNAFANKIYIKSSPQFFVTAFAINFKCLISESSLVMFPMNHRFTVSHNS